MKFIILIFSKSPIYTAFSFIIDTRHISCHAYINSMYPHKILVSLIIIINVLLNERNDLNYCFTQMCESNLLDIYDYCFDY